MEEQVGSVTRRIEEMGRIASCHADQRPRRRELIDNTQLRDLAYMLAGVSAMRLTNRFFMSRRTGDTYIVRFIQVTGIASPFLKGTDASFDPGVLELASAREARIVDVRRMVKKLRPNGRHGHIENNRRIIRVCLRVNIKEGLQLDVYSVLDGRDLACAWMCCRRCHLVLKTRVRLSGL